MKRMNENRKVTLTLEQLKRLVGKSRRVCNEVRMDDPWDYIMKDRNARDAMLRFAKTVAIEADLLDNPAVTLSELVSGSGAEMCADRFEEMKAAVKNAMDEFYG